MTTSLIWFRNDLRLDDNPVVTSAAQADRCLAVYCVDDAQHQAASRYGPPKLGRHRRGFLRQCLIDLRERIQMAGSRLVVLAGDPVVVIPDLCQAAAIDRVHVGNDPGPDERDVVFDQLIDKLAAESRCLLTQHENRSLYGLRQLPFALEAMPRAFTPWRQQIEAGHSNPAEHVMPAPKTLPPAPALPERFVDDVPSAQEWPATATPFRGGETAGQERLANYIWGTRAVTHYAETRNQMLGTDFSSKLSPWLARGCLSPRRVYSEIRAFEQQSGATRSTYALIFELLWRDFFHWTLVKHGAQLFRLGGLLERDDRPQARHADVIHAWRTGRTGSDFVNANMIQLAQTGYMSNRGRQNAASYFARDLGQDWRVGAAWFESMLVDYDVASNWGNWANVAGVGTDKRDRGFDVDAQAKRYDPDGAFVAYWLGQ